nr:MAG TPA: hypothetical protein [Caudoviricetes sp.]
MLCLLSNNINLFTPSITPYACKLWGLLYIWGNRI